MTIRLTAALLTVAAFAAVTANTDLVKSAIVERVIRFDFSQPLQIEPDPPLHESWHAKSDKLRVPRIPLPVERPALPPASVKLIPPSVERPVLPPAPKPKPAPDQRMLPPLQYDRPYTGQLTYIRVASQAEVSKVCPPTPFPLKLGCAHHSLVTRADGSWTTCTVILPVDSVIIAAGYTVDAIYRHEIGHCNGWPGDHAGARLAEAPK